MIVCTTIVVFPRRTCCEDAGLDVVGVAMDSASVPKEYVANMKLVPLRDKEIRMNPDKSSEADSYRPPRQGTSTDAAPKPQESTEAPPSYRIVLIDDMVTLLKILGQGLKRYGHTVFMAASGLEGLKILESNAVDVVVCDLGMPEMDGWAVAETVQTLCKERQVPKVPFILLTGWGAEVADSTARLAKAGVDRVLEKPVEIPGLIEAVAEVVRAGASSEWALAKR